MNTSNPNPKSNLNPNTNSHSIASPVPSSTMNIEPSPRAAPTALNSQSSLGSTSTKVSKRKPRANNKNPIQFFSADANNFMAMVQKLTGIPLNAPQPPLASSQGSPLWSSASNLNMQGQYSLDAPRGFSFSDNTMAGMATIPRIPRFSTSSLDMPSQAGPSSSTSLPSNLGLRNKEVAHRSPLGFTPVMDFASTQITNRLSSSGVTTASVPTCSTTTLPSLWDPLEDNAKLKQEPCGENFNNNHHSVSSLRNAPVHHNDMSMPHNDIVDDGQFLIWDNVLMGNGGHETWSLLQNPVDGKPS